MKLEPQKLKMGKKVLNLSIPYNSRSEDLGFYETLKPGCFNKTISDGFNVRALFNHENLKYLVLLKTELYHSKIHLKV